MTIRITGDGPKITATGSGSTVLVEISTGQHDPGSFSGVHNDLTGRSTTGAHVGTAVSIDPSGFAGNLDESITNAQLLAAAVDDLTTGGGGGGGGVALGETSTTAYRGDRGKTAYDHSQVTTGNPHGTTAADIGAAATSHTHTGTQVTVDASGFNGNLTTSDDTVQEIAQKLDDLTIPAAGIADPGGANDDFLQRKAGAWSARTIAQVKTDLGVGSPLAAQPRTSGVYYTLAGSEGASANAMPSAAGQLRAHPVWLPAGAYNRIGIFTTVAAASTVRLGVYPNNAATMVPDGQTLLFDGGTVNTNATAGLLEITVSFTIPADGVYWLASLCDAYTATPTGIGWQGTVGATPNLPWHGNQAYGSPGGRGSWARTLNSVTTGAMPATFPTASGTDTRVQQIVVRAT